MKLINRTILNYLFVSIPLLVIVGFISYFLIETELRDGMDENLEREKLNVEKLIEELKVPENAVLSYDGLSYIKVIDRDQTFEDDYSDTSIVQSHKDKMEQRNYRMLKTHYKYANVNYQITVVRTTQEEEELMSSLFFAFLLVIGFLILTFIILAWVMSKRLWQPFYETLKTLSKYSLKEHKALSFSPEKITEFSQLNSELNKMTEKIHKDYVQQKEFTENASHEMQTPLAIIKANISLLMQSSNLYEKEMIHLEAIENTTKKLASLNKALILLSKIENNQFPSNEVLHLNTVIRKNVAIFTEVIEAKNIELSVDCNSEMSVDMNPSLADILITNLLQNAIRHNTEGGEIKIKLEDRVLEIANTGTPLNIDSADLFVRFKKNDASKDSLGLGLSIVQSIATLYEIKIEYKYTENFHRFILKF